VSVLSAVQAKAQEGRSDRASLVASGGVRSSAPDTQLGNNRFCCSALRKLEPPTDIDVGYRPFPRHRPALWRSAGRFGRWVSWCSASPYMQPSEAFPPCSRRSEVGAIAETGGCCSWRLTPGSASAS